MSGRLLVAYDNGSVYVPTIAEYLDSLSRYSRWQIRYLHVTYKAKIEFDLNKFDAIFHNYCARLDMSSHVSDDYLRALKSFRGVKMLALQDEYDRTDLLRTAIREMGFHIVLTCVPEHMLEKIYPRTMFPGVRFLTVLTGYVPEHLARRGAKLTPLGERPIHIGYRGRDIGGRYGRLGYLKVEVGRRIRAICEARGVPHDIEWSAEKRIYGDAWYDFIGSCRATLGTESGSNVFDFDGSIGETYNKLSAERGGPVPYEEFRRYTDPIEAQYDMAQISPRVFEAAALRTPMILVSGRYSGLLAPEEHYIELKEDFSNADAVLARLDDLAGLERMAERAYRHLVGSRRFHYRGFIELIDAALEEKAAELSLSLRSADADSQTLEIGCDPAMLADLREEPTRRPRHFVFYHYKRIARENGLYIAQIALLNQALAEKRLARRLKRAIRARMLRAVMALRRPLPADAPRSKRLLWQTARRFSEGLPAFVKDEVWRLMVPPQERAPGVDNRRRLPIWLATWLRR
jgi:hypothetical protein